MPHSSTSDPSPRRRYSIVERRGCFCPRFSGIPVTRDFRHFPIPSLANLSNSIFFSFVGRKSRQDNNTTTRNSNSQSHFSYGTGFLFPSVQLFPTAVPSFHSLFLDISSHAESRSEKVSTFISLKLSQSRSRGCKLDRWMQCWRRPIISRRESPRISHFRRPLIEDRCTSRGSALYMDEGTTDHNDPPPRKHNGALALFTGTHCRPENHSAMTKCCVRAPANML